MNYDENLTYDWLKSLREKLIKEEEANPQQPQQQQAPTNQCPAQYPLAVSAVSPRWAGLWGDFCYRETGGSQIEINPEWVNNNITDAIVGDKKVKLNATIATILPDAYKAAVLASGYKPYIGGRQGPWNPRHVQLNGAQPGISGHSWGMAVDFSPGENDVGTTELRKRDPKFMTFVNTMKEKGFAWGGDQFDDPMHFFYDQKTAANQPFYTSVPGAQPLGGSDSAFGQKDFSDWRGYFRPFLSKLIPDNNPLASLDQQADPLKQFIPNNVLEEIKVSSKKNKFKIIDKTNDKRIEKYKKLLSSMLPYYDERLKLSKPVKIIFVDDKENANNPLGRTAFYAPEKMSITVFTTNRFIKDILRSLGHELIHHKQHCVDEFSDMATPEGYAQKNKKLRKKEEEAYLFGNMLFRDWEDKYKSKHKKEL